ncbi:MAG: carbon-nitrogen hydrolase family protein [Fastidiosipila sp.]|nr:carbon-nitrogen hydrolase family protein [Fastidiosipila sp.]
MVASIQDNDVKMAVFCEYSLTGYRTDLYCISDLVPGVSSDGLEKIAKKHDMWLSGGTVEKVGDKIANVSLMISPTKGLVAKYRKIHPFGQAERDNIVFGDEPIVVDTDLGKVGMTICYDFLFPELVRGLVLQGAEIILNSAFWFADGPAGFAPEQIISLARTRALENNVYVAMASRKGEEKALWGDKLRGFGYSSIVSHTGQTLAIAGLGEVVITAPIDLSTRAEWSEYAPHINDRRPELYKKLLDI